MSGMKNSLSVCFIVDSLQLTLRIITAILDLILIIVMTIILIIVVYVESVKLSTTDIKSYGVLVTLTLSICLTKFKRRKFNWM